jgi:hypothetical protein
MRDTIREERHAVHDRRGHKRKPGRPLRNALAHHATTFKVEAPGIEAEEVIICHGLVYVTIRDIQVAGYPRRYPVGVRIRRTRFKNGRPRTTQPAEFTNHRG